jgi:uroporphyrinogen III methyltransferase/synthase
MRVVLVVREFNNFSSTLENHGFSVINCPTVKTVPVEDLSGFRKIIAALENYDGVFLTSPAAAQIFAENLAETKIEYGGKVYVLGKRSFNLLKSKNLNLFFDEPADSARALLDQIPPKDLNQKHFLFIRGERSMRTVPEFLRTVATLDETIVYETRKIAVKPDKITEIREKIEKNEVEAACFFSPSGAESFLEQFGAAILGQTKIATIGKTTADFFEKRSFTVDLISAKAAAEDFAESLAAFLKF